MNLTEHIFRIANESPDRKLFIDGNDTSFGEFCHIIDGYGALFGKCGVVAGSKCIVLISPSVNMFAVSFALFRMGAVPVMIDPGMGIKAMVRALDKVEAGFVIGMPKTLLIKLLFPAKLKSVSKWIYVPYSRNATYGFSLISNSLPQGKCPVSIPGPKDIAAIFFTSGSTGAAKGVIYQQSQLESQMKILEKHFSYTSNERDLCTFPLIGFFAISRGLSIALARMDMSRPSTMNPSKVIEDLNHHKSTLMFCSPMVLSKLTEYVEKKKITIKTLKHLHIAGAAVNPELIRRFKNHLPQNAIINTPYGATEALPIASISDNEVLDISTNSTGKGVCVGKALERISIKIIAVDDGSISLIEETREVDQGSIGEIMVSGENVTQAYLSNKEANDMHKVFDEKRAKYWHRMGDLGYLDKEQNIWIVGRKAHRIETGNRIYYTLPVEQVFNTHKDVERSALVGIHNHNNVIPVICIELKMRSLPKPKIRKELKNLAEKYSVTEGIKIFLFHKQLPVDPRHNAKIFREKLTVWAQQKAKRYL
jgi:acyl-CoA synthetase (AMP-forming)/AMP-acid ligase II